MSDLLQPGQHPDADQLSAFAEHALPAHEYEKTLAHLAVCPNCRSVVALSMPPIDNAPQPDTVHKPWFFGWKFALSAAAAVAALVILIAETRTTATRPRSDTPTHEATLHSPLSVPRPQETAPVPAVGPASISPNTGTNARPVQSASLATLKAATPRTIAPPTNPSEAIEPSTPHGLVTAGSPPSNPSAGGPAGGIFTDTSGPLSQNIALAPVHPETDASASATASTSPTAMTRPIGSPVAQTPVMPAPPPVRTVSPVALGQAVAPPQMAARQSVHGVALGSGPSLTQTPLPSNLPAISVVSVARRKLAIDSRNTLFLSTDDGKTWKAVPTQWQGHAIKVALVSSITPAQPAATVTTAAAAPAAADFAPRISSARAQPPTTNPTLTGTITDPTGAVVSNADVIVTRKGTSDSRTVKTDNAGNYAVNNLASGDYQVAVRALGFQEQVSTLNVIASEPLLANFTLNVGSATETVSVQANSIALAEIPFSDNELVPSSANNPEPPVFEITTAEGQHWTSADGQTWKPK